MQAVRETARNHIVIFYQRLLVFPRFIAVTHVTETSVDVLPGRARDRAVTGAGSGLRDLGQPLDHLKLRRTPRLKRPHHHNDLPVIAITAAAAIAPPITVESTGTAS